MNYYKVCFNKLKQLIGIEVSVMVKENSVNNGLMTEGSILKQLVNFSLPLLLGNLFQQLYNTADAVIVGNFVGNDALAAVNSSGPIINLLVSLFMGIAIGGSVIISQHFGAQNKEKLHDAVHTTVALGIVGGALMTIVGIFFSSDILRMMGTPEDIIDQSTLYLQIYFAGVLGIVIYNLCSGILRAVGDSKRPLYFLIVSSVINIVLDLLFVAVLDMGVAGVAIATLIAQVVSAILTVYVLVKTKEDYRIIIKDIKFHKEQLIKIIKIGLPSGIQNAIVSFSNVVVQSNINNFGTLAMAGCGSYTKLDGFAILPVMSFSMALTTFTGQNIGAEKYDRVKKGSKTGMLLSIGTTVVISTLLLISGPHILRIFSDDAEVISYGVLMMKFLAPCYIFLAITHSLSGVLRGAGVTTVPMIVMVCCWCFLRMLWILTLIPIYNDIRIVFLGYSVTWFASAVLLFIYYKKSDWLNYSKKL